MLVNNSLEVNHIKKKKMRKKKKEKEEDMVIDFAALYFLLSVWYGLSYY